MVRLTAQNHDPLGYKGTNSDDEASTITTCDPAAGCGRSGVFTRRSRAQPRRQQPPRPDLVLRKGDRIILIGNTFAERMQYYGHFETLLHARFPELELVVHNLGYSADELTLRPRQARFNDHGHTLKDEKPDVLIAAFGFNESFAGPRGLPKFKNDLEKFIKTSTSTKYNGEEPPRLVLLSPIAQEDLNNPHITDGKQNNVNIELYTRAMEELAGKYGAVFVDLYGPTKQLYGSSSEPLTINGVHLNDLGYKRLAPIMMEALFGTAAEAPKADSSALFAAVQEKNLQFFYDYRAVNGCYIYGGRKAPFGVVNFPAEFAKLRKMIQNRERRIWDIAQGKPVPPAIDDSNTGEFVTVKTNVGGAIKITTPYEEAKSFTLPEGYAINLFASEVEFPDLEDPVSMTFDSKGRLWVTTMPSLPHVSARQEAERQGLDPRRRELRRNGRPLQGLRRRAACSHRHRAGRRRRLCLAAAQPDVPQGYRRRRPR